MYPTERFDLIVKLEEYKNQTRCHEVTTLEQIELELKNHDPFYYLKESEFLNIFMVELRTDKLRTALKLANASLNNAFEMVPIESVVFTRPEKIVDKIINISKDKIKDGETFVVKCNISGQKCIKSQGELVQSIYQEMENLNFKPHENNPDWVIHVEVVGENTGISVLKPYVIQKFME